MPEYESSRYITENLAQVIKNQETDLSNYNESESLDRIKKVKQEKEKRLNEVRDELLTHVNEKEKRLLDLAMEKGAGAWLNTSPIKSLGYVLNKRECRDSICLIDMVGVYLTLQHTASVGRKIPLITHSPAQKGVTQ